MTVKNPLSLFLFSLICFPAYGDAFTVKKANSFWQNDRLLLQADIHYELNKTLLDALNNGVSLVISQRIELHQISRYFWNEYLTDSYLWTTTQNKVIQSFQLEYHSLSQQYTLTNLQSLTAHHYANLDKALIALGRIKNLSLLTRKEFNPEDEYQAQIYTWLNTNELPLPLQISTYFSPEWEVISQWYRWSVLP